MITKIEGLQQHQLVILRRLRSGPLTEFELAREVAKASAFTHEEAAERMADWLEELRLEGLVWAGDLADANCQTITAAALTNRGRKLVS